MTTTVDTAIACPNPAKSRFATKEAAEASAVHNRLAVGKPLYAYECEPACGWWHLTSKPHIAATATDVAAVHRLTPEQFRHLVILDAQHQAPRVRAVALREPSLVHKWLTAIRDINRDLADQMPDHQGQDPASKEWRRAATQLQQNLGARSREAGQIIHSLRRAPGTSVNHREAPLRTEAGELAVSWLIEAHQAEFTAYLLEEYVRVGATIPDRLRRHQLKHGIPDPEPPS